MSYPMQLHPDFEACRHLWVSVILQAFQDAASSRNPPRGYDLLEWRRNRFQARHFLRNGFGNLGYVCELAGVDETVVKRWGTDPRILNGEINIKRFKSVIEGDVHRKKPRPRPDTRGGVA